MRHEELVEGSLSFSVWRGFIDLSVNGIQRHVGHVGWLPKPHPELARIYVLHAIGWVDFCVTSRLFEDRGVDSAGFVVFPKNG